MCSQCDIPAEYLELSFIRWPRSGNFFLPINRARVITEAKALTRGGCLPTDPLSISPLQTTGLSKGLINRLTEANRPRGGGNRNREAGAPSVTEKCRTNEGLLFP